MPITRRQFELEIDTKTEEWMEKIRAFLAEHKDEAFTLEEIRQHYEPTLLELLSDTEKKIVQHLGTQTDAFFYLPDEKSAFYLALEKLVEQLVVVRRTIRDVYYYSWYETDEF